MLAARQLGPPRVYNSRGARVLVGSASRGCWRIRFLLRPRRPQSAEPNRSAPVPGRSRVAGSEVLIHSSTLAPADVAVAEDGRTPTPPHTDRTCPGLSHVGVPAGEQLLAGDELQLRDARIRPLPSTVRCGLRSRKPRCRRTNGKGMRNEISFSPFLCQPLCQPLCNPPANTPPAHANTSRTALPLPSSVA